jgi:hypothetical protein
MSEPPKSLDDIPIPEVDTVAWIYDMSRQTEPTYALVSASTVEDWVRHALIAKMRNDLSSKLSERLFEGYGPLSSFSGKIDIAYALNIFPTEIYNDLRAIKDIRNKFAHAKDYLHFNSVELAPDIQKLTGWSTGSNPQTLFIERVNACVEVCKKHLETAALVAAVRAYKHASPDKSDAEHLARQTILGGNVKVD